MPIAPAGMPALQGVVPAYIDVLEPFEGLDLVIFLMSEIRCGVFLSHQAQVVAQHKLFLCGNHGCPYRVKASSCLNFIIYTGFSHADHPIFVQYYKNYQYRLVLPPCDKK